MDGAGGDIVASVGTGDEGDGGDIILTAGKSTAQAAQGGSVFINGGEGANSHTNDGGDGGDIFVTGGASQGLNINDNAGDISLEGGKAYAGYGGNIKLVSGAGTSTTSGSILINTANAGVAGVSGGISLSSGTSSLVIPATLILSPVELHLAKPDTFASLLVKVTLVKEALFR